MLHANVGNVPQTVVQMPGKAGKSATKATLIPHLAAAAAIRKLARPERFERPTLRFVVLCSAFQRVSGGFAKARESVGVLQTFLRLVSIDCDHFRL